MEQWLLEFSSEAERDLAKLDHETRRRIINKLDWLSENFDNLLPLILTGEFREFYKLRAGDLRVIYKINRQKQIIIICYIDRRDKIYKKK